ncbi:hypothetical protein B0H14DRAFT_2368606, partial [Mycena olivaceomarginata]
CPQDAPPWFQHTFKEVSRQCLGTDYDALLEAFTAWEQSSGWAASGKLKALPNAPRPTQLADWIKDARGKTLAVRLITDTKCFATTWWQWWTGMQPSWRDSRCGRAGSRCVAVLDKADWGSLQTSGQNGLLSVVATLYWWGCAEKGLGEGNTTSDWNDAVADTTWVLRSWSAIQGK